MWTHTHTYKKKQPAASLKSSLKAAFRSRAGWRTAGCRRRRIRSFFIVNIIGTSRSPHLPSSHVWLRWTLQQRSASPSRRWRWSELKDKWKCFVLYNNIKVILLLHVTTLLVTTHSIQRQLLLSKVLVKDRLLWLFYVTIVRARDLKGEILWYIYRQGNP